MVIRHSGFRPEVFTGNAWKRSFKAEGAFRGDADDSRSTKLCINIPIAKKYRNLPVNNGARFAPFEIDNFEYRPLCGFIKAVAEKDPAACRFVYTPYEEFVRLPNGDDMRLHGEMYATSEWILEHDRVQELYIPPEREKGGGTLPRALFGLMFGSDETVLAQFGSASAWPCYAMAGNQSKYERARPSMHAIHRIAQFVKLPDAVQQFITTRQGGVAAKRALLTYCKREAFHTSWKVLLDDDFLEAYEWGMVVDCADGVTRLLFPRIFTYTADYPEKCLIASIKDLGTCPCPRCLVKKDDIPRAGQRYDMQRRVTSARTDNDRRRGRVESAQNMILEHGITVDSTSLDPFLKEQSLTPNRNAFSDRLRTQLFDFFRMLVVDLLHEFEIGVWKAIFTHMLRILQAHDKNLLAELNRRSVIYSAR
ncbi:hypothetical protein AURDEDRAFT_58600 [Auricularia subglabra TFB-10046 SS5]|nr:hypothetical protein AURDEDRAFT_58600 [Auricularia subglabra TFB-10046 SS5]